MLFHVCSWFLTFFLEFCRLHSHHPPSFCNNARDMKQYWRSVRGPIDSRSKSCFQSFTTTTAWSSISSCFRSNFTRTSLVPCFLTTCSYTQRSIKSPMAKSFTSISSGNAPESSIVLKKIGAMVLPITKPPVRLFGAQGMSWPWPQSQSWSLQSWFYDELFWTLERALSWSRTHVPKNGIGCWLSGWPRANHIANIGQCVTLPARRMTIFNFRALTFATSEVWKKQVIHRGAVSNPQSGSEHQWCHLVGTSLNKFSKKYPPEYHKFITDITTNPLSTPNIKESFCEGDSDIRLPSFSMAKACKGISGRDQASGAGDKSSVFVSPVTLKTQSVTWDSFLAHVSMTYVNILYDNWYQLIQTKGSTPKRCQGVKAWHQNPKLKTLSGTSGRFVNHSAFAQDSMTWHDKFQHFTHKPQLMGQLMGRWADGHLLGIWVALLHLLFHIIESIEHQDPGNTVSLCCVPFHFWSINLRCYP